ncbi:MAG TPA: amidohydrolase, partial [Agriterribacter sp.]|nr:amidohydrolase [Agriterribacter sp.]
MTCIDTHVHFWQYNRKRDSWMDDMKVLQQDYIPPTIESTLRRNDVDGCVAVQADQSEVETRFLCELANTYSFIKGVVGWVDLCADNVEERLQHFSAYSAIKGYRHIVQGEPNDFLLRKDFQRGVKALKAFDYTYDILIYHYQLKPALEFVSELPG